MIDSLLAGFSLILNPASLAAIIFGLFGGILVGALPGLSATMAIALLSPFTFFMPPEVGIPFLLGLFKAAIYAGSIPAITINTPGTAAAAATSLDGFVLAQKGQARKALEMSLFASVTGDLIGTIVLILLAAWLASVALSFGPPEFAMLYAMALITITSVSGRHATKALLSASLGLLLACIGLDPMSGAQRFTFGSIDLLGGLPLIPILIGLFALSEVFVQAERLLAANTNSVFKIKREERGLTADEFRRTTPTIARSTGIGMFIGILPGIGAEISTWLAYGSAKRASRHPEEYGQGSLEGVAASEAGNNAACPACLIPLTVFGIPGDTVTAVMLGAFIAQGLTPGPLLFVNNSPLMYSLFASLLVSNLLLLVIGYFGIRLFTLITEIPARVLYPVVAALCIAGAFAVNSSSTDVLLTLIAGVIGYLMRKINMPTPPLVIALLVAPGFENALRQSLTLSGGSLSIFVTRPVSASLLALIVLAVCFLLWRQMRPTEHSPNSISST
ncbi:MAG: tripartite tricarboxylate transporter permease [Burkholderiaceae bacterium]